MTVAILCTSRLWEIFENMMQNHVRICKTCNSLQFYVACSFFLGSQLGKLKILKLSSTRLAFKQGPQWLRPASRGWLRREIKRPEGCPICGAKFQKLWWKVTAENSIGWTIWMRSNYYHEFKRTVTKWYKMSPLSCLICLQNLHRHPVALHFLHRIDLKNV